MAQIDYYLFPLSPFTYFAGMELEEIAGKHKANITYKPFNLMEVFSKTGGTPLPERHESRKRYRLQELERIARRRGLPINPQPLHWPTNPVPASCVIISAQAKGGGNLGLLCHSILRACWADEEDIADDTTLKSLLEHAGFDPAIADNALVESVSTYEKNTQDAIDAHVFGAPSYVIDDQVFWGQDRLAYLDDYLAHRK
ncbi:MAG: 2-hydroxychromene-2-carboxylate isomerase [Rubricella sp.]